MKLLYSACCAAEGDNAFESLYAIVVCLWCRFRRVQIFTLLVPRGFCDCIGRSDFKFNRGIC